MERRWVTVGELQRRSCPLTLIHAQPPPLHANLEVRPVLMASERDSIKVLLPIAAMGPFLDKRWSLSRKAGVQPLGSLWRAQ